MSNLQNVVIAGGGLAAVRTAQALRERAFAGRIALYADEAHWPYDRPPLTKNFLLGKVQSEAIGLLTAEQAERAGIEVHLARAAAGLDRAQRQLLLGDGTRVQYGQLVIATGARPRMLAGFAGSSNAHALRTQEDARRLRVALVPGARLVVLGAGFVGLEVASVAAALGCTVHVVDQVPVPLAAVLGATMGTAMQRWHESKGVQFHCGASVHASEQCDGRIVSIQLQGGETLAVDAVLVAIGQQANVEWLADSGLLLQQGVAVDDWGRTADPLVFAVGDVASHGAAGVWRPTRHWTAVTEQAPRVAQALMGLADGSAWVDEHYFWSDQHGLRLQFAGEVRPDAEWVWQSGSAEADRFVALACENERVTGVFSRGSPRDFMMASARLSAGELLRPSAPGPRFGG